MKRLRHICLPLVCVGMLLGLVANAAPDVCADVKDSPGVLLINKPDLYASPSSNGQKSATPWPAGSSVQTLDCTSDAATSGASVRWYRVKVQATEGWLPEVFLGLAPIAVEADKNLPIGREPLSRYRPLPPGYKPDDLVPVGPPNEKDREYLLRKEAAENLRHMVQAAREAKIRLVIVSAWRPWSYQQEIYERTLKQKGWGQTTVAQPGLSEHQLGTAADLGDGDPAHLLNEDFGDSPAGQWLRENAWKYGFAQSFTRHNQPQTGIAPEPWHFRYWGLDRARSHHMEALGIEQ